ncbi:hypothetical protein SAMN02800694_3446 [Luteibacter sp. UNCMF331Sha3.1]|uniref:hypothetical protein n=1 Tax=Luteibacter sp. UNCMF331Sha3.1 TaxID=1502760 RepID=UPI0008D3B8A1|nr:hypothetical protein [Luteibacter sp. UNCMF331Sha3.1]SEN42406.1 hypothetical protein SAMN02800694_3446 [Luteibacter sp. UNCMF331Sha3.1]
MTQHTAIAWIKGSTDGEREARNLAKLYPKNAKLVGDTSALTEDHFRAYASVIVVGHRSELKSQKIVDSVLNPRAARSKCWIVLACCETAKAEGTKGTLEDRELWDPADKLAHDLKLRVSGTTRDLTFDEVGKGYAFALALGEWLIRSNPSDRPGLWKDIDPGDDVDFITRGLQNL